MLNRRFGSPEAWARFGDAGRFGLIGAALTLPLRRGDSDSSFDSATAILATSAVCKALKPCIPEARPNGEDRKSFPSQHSGESFAAALSLARGRGPLAGALLGGAAALVAVSRLLADKHHPRDVVAGAAIGIAAGVTVAAFSGRMRAAPDPLR